VLGGAPTGPDICDTATSSARVSHFFGALRVSAFREAGAFRADMDRMLSRLRQSPPAEGEERVYFAGQKEFEFEARALAEGVPIQAAACESLRTIAHDLSLTPPLVRTPRGATS
jgi:LDH2 family malate/lactate/ureidoglycolate dehydrogenase